MANGKKHRFSQGKDRYIVFDSNGYIVEARGLGYLMWSTSLDLDKEVVGKHVDELAEMLKKHYISRNAYLEFEASVHVSLLKEMLKDAKH